MEIASSAAGTLQYLVLLSARHACGTSGSLARELLKFDARKRVGESRVGWQVIALSVGCILEGFFEMQENQADVGRASCYGG